MTMVGASTPEMAIIKKQQYASDERQAGSFKAVTCKINKVKMSILTRLHELSDGEDVWTPPLCS